MGDQSAKKSRQSKREPVQSDREQEQGSEAVESAGAANDTGSETAENRNDAAGVEGIKVVGENGDAKVLGFPAVSAPKSKKKSSSSKKKAKKPSASADPFIVGALTGLITTGFGIVAMRAGAHWEVTEQEAKSLAEPTVRILERYGLLEKIVKSSDFIALGIAAASVFVPRIMISAELAKQKKGAREHVRSESGGNDAEATAISGGSGRTLGTRPRAVPTVAKELAGPAVAADFG